MKEHLQQEVKDVGKLPNTQTHKCFNMNINLGIRYSGRLTDTLGNQQMACLNKKNTKFGKIYNPV